MSKDYIISCDHCPSYWLLPAEEHLPMDCLVCSEPLPDRVYIAGIIVITEERDVDKVCWEVCGMCEDYLCNIHQVHLADCDCEDMEWWAEHGMDPYDTLVSEYLKNFAVVILEEN